ncbi:DUF1622 domain-containing protein [Proteinivorax tanatarense]|uniref:DUF1622 domain-containing protein n=1 Tax=Proteinivorax tanatarense TaxID=1260629 RepID=A0AAU7VPI2_9FIRM
MLEWFAALVIVAVSIIVLTGYIFSLFKPAEKLRLSLARGLALGLEFALAGEILRTILIRELEEIFILGAIIIIRASLSVLIHWEISHTVNCLQGECEIHDDDEIKHKK